jgi:hypothetical protein
MNQAVYNHKKKNYDRLCAEQNKASRAVKNYQYKLRHRFVLTNDERFKLLELEHANEQLVERCDALADELLTFELFGELV